MFHYVNDKDYLKRAQSYCAELLTDLTQELLDKNISSQFFLVGSGARNMVTQNSNESIDFDYNLYVQKCDDINNCQSIKETVRKTFNKVLKAYNLYDCDDSTSSLTTKPIYFKDSPKIQFSIDLCIVAKNDKGSWFRLIHEKTGYTASDRYFWNEAPNSKNEILIALDKKEFLQLNISNEDKLIYNRFISDIINCVVNFIEKRELEENVTNVLNGLKYNLEVNCLNYKIENIPNLLRVFIKGNYKYYKSREIEVEDVQNFYDWLISKDENYQNIVMKNIVNRLSSIPMGIKDELPF